MIRCIGGAVADFVVDLRPDSQTFLESVRIDLSAENGRAVFVPPGFAHGFQTLEENSTVFYEMTTYYNPSAGAGLRFDDPALDINLPDPVTVIAERDASYPDSDPTDFEYFCGI